MVESWVREALIKLNPKSPPSPNGPTRSSITSGPVSSQCRPTVWCGPTRTSWPGSGARRPCPFGEHGEHVSIRLVDADQPGNNRFTVTNQWVYQAGPVEKRFDLVFLANGLPLVIGEAKTPTRAAVTWFDGAFQINQIYEKEVPAMFVPNVFSFATEGRRYRYGAIRLPIDQWCPWRAEDNHEEGQLHHVKTTVQSMLRPEVMVDILQNFTLFATDKKHRAHQDHLPLPAIRRPPTRSWTGWWRAIPRKASSGISRGAASRSSWSSPP